MVLGIFKIVLRLRDGHAFMGQSPEIFNVFNTLTLKQSENHFKKLEYRFLVESSKIENVPFLYKTTLVEASIKTNRTRSTK